MTNLFAQALKNKVRFQTEKGLLTVEDLFDLSLNSLNVIYQRLSKSKKELSGDALFESEDLSKRREEKRLEDAMAIVKTVFEIRQKEIQEKESRQAKALEKRRLLEALAEKREEGIKQLDEDEILARLAELE